MLELKLIKGDPKNLQGKASFFIRELNENKIYVLICSVDSMNLKKFIEKYCHQPELNVNVKRDDNLIFYPGAIVLDKLSDLDKWGYKDTERIDCGTIFADINEIYKIFSHVSELYLSHLRSQQERRLYSPNSKDPATNLINTLVKKDTYGELSLLIDSWKIYKKQRDIRKAIKTKSRIYALEKRLGLTKNI